jgi:hypothetical protein
MKLAPETVAECSQAEREGDESCHRRPQRSTFAPRACNLTASTCGAHAALERRLSAPDIDAIVRMCTWIPIPAAPLSDYPVRHLVTAGTAQAAS